MFESIYNYNNQKKKKNCIQSKITYYVMLIHSCQFVYLYYIILYRAIGVTIIKCYVGEGESNDLNPQRLDSKGIILHFPDVCNSRCRCELYRSRSVNWYRWLLTCIDCTASGFRVVGRASLNLCRLLLIIIKQYFNNTETYSTAQYYIRPPQKKVDISIWWPETNMINIIIYLISTKSIKKINKITVCKPFLIYNI
jgi:hypothetical protein